MTMNNFLVILPNRKYLQVLLRAPNLDLIGILAKIVRVFRIDFIALNESRRIHLQFATNRIKIGPLKPEIQPAKGAQRRYVGPVMSRDALRLPPVTISLVTLYNCFFNCVKLQHQISSVFNF